MKHPIKRQIPVITLMAVLVLTLSVTVITQGFLLKTSSSGDELLGDSGSLIDVFEPEDIPLADPSLIGTEPVDAEPDASVPGILMGVVASVAIIPLSSLAFKLFSGSHK